MLLSIKTCWKKVPRNDEMKLDKAVESLVKRKKQKTVFVHAPNLTFQEMEDLPI